MTTTKIWCLLVNHNYELQERPFRVSVLIDPDFIVDDLKEAIKATLKPALDYLPAARLTVWKCEDPDLLAGVRERKEKLPAINFEDETVIKNLVEELAVEDLKIAKNEKLLVMIPGMLPFLLDKV